MSQLKVVFTFSYYPEVQIPQGSEDGDVMKLLKDHFSTLHFSAYTDGMKKLIKIKNRDYICPIDFNLVKEINDFSAMNDELITQLVGFEKQLKELCNTNSVKLLF